MEVKVILEEVIDSKDLRKEAIVLNLLCRADFVLGNLTEALNYGLLSLERINENWGSELVIKARTFNNLAIVYLELGDFTQALDCYMKSSETFDNREDSKNLGILLGNIGNLYLDIGKRQKAIENYEKAIALLQPISYTI